MNMHERLDRSLSTTRTLQRQLAEFFRYPRDLKARYESFFLFGNVIAVEPLSLHVNLCQWIVPGGPKP